jgi:carboxyl-terminal processing protease
MAAAPIPSSADYQEDAQSLVGLIRDNYAYIDELPGGVVPSSAALNAERDAVHDQDSLLRYAEDAITALADHHALTGRSFKDDWAIVPSYSDIWIVKSGEDFVVDAVKESSVAEHAGVHVGDRLVAVDGVLTATAIKSFWARLGLSAEGERAPYAARVLAAGRRDRTRKLTFGGPQGVRTLVLDSVYTVPTTMPALSVASSAGRTTIRFNNSIGDQPTIAAFDAAMAAIPSEESVVLDLTDTPSGGTTSIARAVMGWFVTKPSPYQMHQLPAEERETGIPRQWVEYVLPRLGKYHSGPVSIRVGRWTGSMGEGLAVGFRSLQREVCGTRMAGLKGAVYDFDLPKTGLRVKFPAERLFSLDGTPRHHFVPPSCGR